MLFNLVNVESEDGEGGGNETGIGKCRNWPESYVSQPDLPSIVRLQTWYQINRYRLIHAFQLIRVT